MELKKTEDVIGKEATVELRYTSAALTDPYCSAMQCKYVIMYVCNVCVGARALSILWRPFPTPRAHTNSSQIKWPSLAPSRLALMLLDNLVVWDASGKWITGVGRVSRGTITQPGDSMPAGVADG